RSRVGDVVADESVVPLEYAVNPRRGLRDGFVQSFAQFHLDRLERRSSGGASLPACRRPYPPDGRGLVPGIQYPRAAGYEMVGIVDAIGTNVSGCTAGHRVGARAETLSPARARPPLCIISEGTKAPLLTLARTASSQGK